MIKLSNLNFLFGLAIVVLFAVVAWRSYVENVTLIREGEASPNPSPGVSPGEKADLPPLPAPELVPPIASQGSRQAVEPSGVGGIPIGTSLPTGCGIVVQGALAFTMLENRGFDPDRETLRALTVDVWDNADFLQLTEREARAMFPLDPDVPSFPHSIASLVGDLPGDAELEAGMRSAVVRSALLELADTCSLLLEFDTRAAPPNGDPGEPRASSKAFKATREELARLRDEQQLELCKRLDAHTGFHDWTLLCRLYRQWERTP